MPTLVLLRHGESEWNLANRFTGWVDVDLSERGIAEAIAAGRMLRDAGLRPDIVHTSVQRRAIRTAELALAELGGAPIPIKKSWRLNERHYGALQGLNKKETVQKFGEEQVLLWRRSYSTRPEPLSDQAMAEQRRDPAYASVPDDAMPATECLADVVARLLPYWDEEIVPDLRAGRLVLVCAHGNSLRALVKHLDGLSEEQVVELTIPTGIPLVYRLDRELAPVSSDYLGDPEAVAAAIDTVARQTG
jgi:2,3-bisphosphoglycerate-dependent phosphoglycerate mutase